MWLKLGVIGLALGVAGCGSLVPSTVARLAGLSPLEADPAGIEVALDLPAGAGVMPDSATLLMASSRSDTGESIEATFILERVDGDLPRWRFAREDLREVREFQAAAGAWETEAPVANSGSISVYVQPCRTNEALAPDARLSIFVRTRVGGVLLPLARNVLIAGLAETEDIEAFPMCP